MTNEEHKAAAMLLGGDPYYTLDKYIARVPHKCRRFVGMKDYDYINIETLEVITTQSEIEKSIERYKDD